MLRVIFDTNIYISAILFGGIPETLFELAASGELKVYISPAINEELQRILSQKFSWQASDVEKTMRVIADFTHLVNPQVSVNVLKRVSPVSKSQKGHVAFWKCAQISE